MKTKVVIDTNVFVSGIFFSGPPYRILKAWQDDKIQISVSADIIEEYRRVIDTLSEKIEGINIDPITGGCTALKKKAEPSCPPTKHPLKSPPLSGT